MGANMLQNEGDSVLVYGSGVPMLSEAEFLSLSPEDGAAYLDMIIESEITPWWLKHYAPTWKLILAHKKYVISKQATIKALGLYKKKENNSGSIREVSRGNRRTFRKVTGPVVSKS
jgi:hypothetical protein